MEPELEESETAGAGDWACLVRTSRRRAEERSAGLQEESPISRIFGGVLRSVVRSKGAKADSVSLEPFNFLALDISDSSVTPVRSALEACCKSEAINEGQTRRIEFKVLPHVLVLSLKRFTYTRGKAQKIKKAIQYGDKLTFDRSWLTQPGQAQWLWFHSSCPQGQVTDYHRGQRKAEMKEKKTEIVMWTDAGKLKIRQELFYRKMRENSANENPKIIN